MAQSIKHQTLAQVMILQFVTSSPALGSVLTAQSLDPTSDSVSFSLSIPLPLALCFSVSLSKINVKKKNEDEKDEIYVGFHCARGCSARLT